MNMKNMKMKKCFDFDKIVGLIDECRQEQKRNERDN